MIREARPPTALPPLPPRPAAGRLEGVRAVPLFRPRRAPVAAAAVLALAAVLRLPGVWRFPLEQDELYTVWESRLLWDVPLEPGIDARPLYFLLQHGLSRLFPGDGAAVLRAAPLVFGLLGVWLAWRVGRRVVGPHAGVLAAFLVAVSPWHLHASGMARYWSLLFVLSAAFFFFLSRGYDTDRPRDFGAALLALVAGMLTHPTFLVPAAGAALGASLVTRDGRLGWRWPSRAAWTRLWIPFLLLAVGFWLALAATGRGDAVRNWGGRGWLASLRLVPAMVEWLTPAVVVAGIAGALLLAGERDAARRRWGVMTVTGCGAALVLLVAASTRTDVYADYAVAMLPLLFVSAGALAQLAAERLRARPAAGPAVLAALLGAAALPSVASHLSDGTRFDYRPAFRHVEREAPGRLVLAWPLILQRHYAPALRAAELRPDPARAEAALAAEGELWVVASVKRYGIALDDSGALAAWLARRCRRSAAFERPRWDYRVHRVEVWRCTAGAGEAGAG
jgi:hypothetical protein